MRNEFTDKIANDIISARNSRAAIQRYNDEQEAWSQQIREHGFELGAL